MSAHSLAGLLVAGTLLFFPGPARPAVPSETAQSGLVTRTYAVADLVVPLRESRGPKQTEEARLIRLLQSSVAAGTWAAAGGKGTVDYFPLTMSLVVCQTPAVHEQVAETLQALRRQMDEQVAMELRLVTVPAELFEKLGLNQPDEKAVPGLAFLDDAQVRVLLETVQADSRTNVLQAPKLTMFNGQKAGFDLGEKQAYVTGVEVTEKEGRNHFQPRTQSFTTGLQVSVVPAISPDRRQVTLQLDVRMTQMLTPQAVTPAGLVPRDLAALAKVVKPPRFHTLAAEKTLKVGAGKTALLTGWSYQREVRHEVSPPLLQQIPYLSRLFRNVGYGRETEHLIVLVTPRVIVAKETEEAKPVEGSASPDAAAVYPVQSDAAPADKEVRHVRGRQFVLSYEVENVGSSQLRSVEVWWTRDGNRWERYPDEVRPTGKVPVVVKHEGRWGFCLVPRNGAGLAGAAPRDGDPGQVWVEVDQTPPVVTLSPVEIGGKAGEEAVVLRWQAADRNLAPRPVTVLYAEDPSGPWKVMAEGLDATATFNVRGDELPPTCHFRIDATDRAGNVGSAHTPAGVKTDLKVPVIRGVKVNAGEIPGLRR